MQARNMLFRSALLLMVALAGLSLAGCLTSKEPFLSESEEARVPDFSGEYTSGQTSRTVSIVHKSNNLFHVTRGEGEAPEEAVVVPLDFPDAYLLQFYDGEDYLLTTMVASKDKITLAVFMAGVQEVMGNAMERDDFRKLASTALQEQLDGLMQQHGISADSEYELQNRPSIEALKAFYNDCLRTPGVLTDSEVLTRK